MLRMTLMFKNKDIAYIWSAVFVNVLFYLYLIVRHPYFLTDDYVHFGLINSNFSNFVTLNLNHITDFEKLYFLTRPLNYILSLFNLKVFFADPLLMKIFALMLHSALLFSVYLLLKQLLLFYKLEINRMALFLTIIFFGLHPNNMWWIYWIGNQSELLMILFFVISLYSVFLYTNNSDKKYLNYYLLFYILSILTKQEGLNLPVLVLIFFYFNKDKISSDKLKGLRNYSLAGICIMILYSAFTFIFSSNNLKLEYLLKKPFSLIGNLLYVIFPFNSLSSYSYFVEHKLITYVLCLTIIFILVLLVSLRKLKLRSLLFATLITVVSFYPRIYDGANNRINTIQLLLFSIILFFLLRRKNVNIKYYMGGILFIIFLNIIEIFSLISFQKGLKDIQYNQASEYLKVQEENKTVAIAFYSFYLPYQTYFERNKNFGKDSLKMLPLSYSFLIEGNSFQDNIKISCSEKNDTLYIKNEEDPYIRIDVEKYMPGSENYMYLQNNINYNKGFKSLALPLSDKDRSEKYIYYNGKKWLTLD